MPGGAVDFGCKLLKAATNLVQRLRKYSYPVRLRMIGITSLEDRRIRGDMIEVYKLLTGKEKIDYKQFFNFTNAHQRTREGTTKRQIKIRHKEILLQSKSGQWME